MNSEQQQQRIMTYFIEEAQEHLQTIEQGVLDLQDVLADVERINELFRAAHSIKGGAAMLDLRSIQHISHRLEDYFKILKDNTGVEVDEKLKSLFLAGCDRLHELLDYLQENYTIAEELAATKVAEVEPVFSDLESHLNILVAVVAPTEDTSFREQRAERHAYEDLMVAFQGGVADELRNMLQLFKQEDNQTTRQQLQNVCDRLLNLAEHLGISGWQGLISTSKLAISDLTNPYLTLAQVIIRDIRQAQDLVLAQRSQEISISDQLQALTKAQKSLLTDDQSIDTFWEDQGSEEFSDNLDIPAEAEEDLFGDLDIGTQTEDNDFLLGVEAGSTEQSNDFDLELLEVDDFSNELEGNGEDYNFDWDAVESNEASNDDVLGQSLDNEAGFSDLLGDIEESVDQSESEFLGDFADSNSFLQEETDSTLDFPTTNDEVDESTINDDIDTGGEYDLDREFSVIETEDAYNLDIDNSIDDFEADDLEVVSSFDGEFDFNDGLTDEEASDTDLEDFEVSLIEDSDMDIAAPEDVEVIEDIEAGYISDQSTEAENDPFNIDNMGSILDDDFELGELNEWEQVDDIDPFATVTSTDEQSDMAAQDVDPFAVDDDLGAVDADISSDEGSFVGSFSLDSSSDDEFNLNSSSESSDSLEEIFEEDSGDLHGIAENVNVGDRLTNVESDEFSWQEEDIPATEVLTAKEDLVDVDNYYVDPERTNEQASTQAGESWADEVNNQVVSSNVTDDITESDITNLDAMQDLPDTVTSESESGLLGNVPADVAITSPLTPIIEKVDDTVAEESDDDLSVAFAVDELFELEALGFDLNDAEEEDNYVLQGLAASDRYNISSDEVPDLTQPQQESQESTDNDLGMSDFFSEEANELLGDPVSISEDLGLSVSSSDAVTQIESGEDFLQLENMDLDEHVFAPDPEASVNDNAESLEVNSNEIPGDLGDLNDLDFQLDLGASNNDEIADLFAVQDAGETSLQSENTPDDANTEEIGDFLDLFADTETSEFTSSKPANEELLDIAIPQQDDVSVLDDLTLDGAESTSDDVDLDNLFSDSDNLQRNDVPESSENGREEILTVESLDISQSDVDLVDFNELLDLGIESSDLSLVDEIQQFVALESLESTEQLKTVNTEELAESVHPKDVAATASDILDTSSDDDDFEGEGNTETAFLDDIEDLVRHHSSFANVILETTTPQMKGSLDSHHDLKEVDTVLQDKDEVVEFADLSQEPAIESRDRDLHESDTSEDSAENMSFGESTNPSNTEIPTELANIVQNDADHLIWEEQIVENVAQLPEEDDVNALQTNVQAIDDELQLEDLLAEVDQQDRQSLDDMTSEAAFSDPEHQDFDVQGSDGNSDFNKDFKGFNTTDLSDLSDPSDLDDEFSSIMGFIEKDSDLPDLGNKEDEFSEVFGFTDLDFPESDSDIDEGDGGVQKPKDRQPTPTSPGQDIDPTSGNHGDDRLGASHLSSDNLWGDGSEITTEGMPSKMNTLGNVIDTVSDVISVPAGDDLPTPEPGNNSDGLEIFDELEALLTTPATPVSTMSAISTANKVTQTNSSSANDFDDLEALLASPAPKSRESASSSKTVSKITKAKKVETDEFDELEMLLRDTYGKDVGPVNTKTVKRQALAKRAVSKIVSQTMKVDVKHLDSLNNLVGELVVNRNLLEQDQEKLQQFIGNLLFKVQQLGDVAQRMRDQYDRSLLENSIMASRPKSNTSDLVGRFADSSDRGTAVTSTFEDIEFDRYNSFHILSQEIIELVVRVRESASDIEFVVDETEQVSRQLGTITTQIQDDLKQVRMVPFAQIADRLPRAVRDLSFKTGKQADIEMHGRETLIDKAILEQLYDPMTHLVNNAIVHGLEDPETRQAGGKPTLGKIVIRAFHQGNQTVISISDDGAGINTDKVKQSAVNKGLYTQSEVAQLSDVETFDLLFEAGFSTKSQADELAGRGVGLDVVRTAINDIRGSVHTDSSIGKGTTFTIRLPLTLSISKAMFCISDRARIAFPVDGFEDIIEISQAQVQLNSKGQPCLPWRDTILPFQPLSNLLAYNRHINRGNIYGRQDDDVLSVIILRSEGNFLALQVDQFLGENEIVIKQLEGPIPKPAGIAGATILGDGKVMAIANVLELFDIAAGRLRPSISSVPVQPVEDEQPANEPTVLIVDDSITVRELLSLTFSKVGYRVEQARDGQDAWEKLRAGLPCNLIFCDIEMPRMDGLELLSRLQKDEFLSQIPVAMLTSRGADRHRQTASQLGAKGYFTKPYLEEELLSGSQRMLKGEVLI